MEISKTFDNSKLLVQLPCSLREGKSFQICVHIAGGWGQGSTRNNSCAGFWRTSGPFFPKDILLPAARCFGTLDKFTVLKSPHKCFVNCSILSGRAQSLVTDSHHVFIPPFLVHLYFYAFSNNNNSNKRAVIIGISVLIMIITVLATETLPAASWKLPQSRRASSPPNKPIKINK